MGMLVAMVLFMSAMGDYTQSDDDMSAMQSSVAAGYMASSTEGGTSGAWNAISNMTGGAVSGMAIAGAASTTNPVGWGYWVTTGVLAL